MTQNLTIPVPPVSTEVPLANIQVSDTTAHTPATDPFNGRDQGGMQVAAAPEDGFTIVVYNATNQTVVVTLFGASDVLDVPTPGLAARFQDAFDLTISVAAATQESQTYTPGTTGWLPLVWASITAAVAPNGANVRVLLVPIA